MKYCFYEGQVEAHYSSMLVYLLPFALPEHGSHPTILQVAFHRSHFWLIHRLLFAVIRPPEFHKIDQGLNRQKRESEFFQAKDSESIMLGLKLGY